MWGVIDIGSNTVRLVTYELENGELHPLINKKHAAGLINYINDENRLTNDGIKLLIGILNELNYLSNRIKLDELFPFATASLRNISNTEEVLEIIQKDCGLSVRVLTGREEALLDFYGATRNVEAENGILVDVGGGSTELVFYSKEGPIVAESFPFGSLNLFQRHITGILPLKNEVRSIRQDVTARLKQMPLIENFNCDTICAVGGSARSTQSLISSLNDNQTNRYSPSDLKNIIKMIKKDRMGLSRSILKVTPERIHTLIPGLTIIQAVSEYYGAKEIFTSNTGVREGYLYKILEERGVCSAK